MNKEPDIKAKKRKLGSAQLAISANLQDTLLSQVSTFLAQQLRPNQHVLLGLSGGLDSCVLLHLLAVAQQIVPFQLHAMHVHHGLSVNADAWATFCTEQCVLLNIPLQIIKVDIEASPKLGIEAAARQLRYEALFNNVLPELSVPNQADFIVTAHHQDDQAETLLLQLFRGAGVKGLASMAAVDPSRRLLRPLLEVSRQTLQDYAERHQLKWCDDESNADTYYERNFLRHNIMPILETRYPAIKSVLARSASHLAEANELLDALAELDATTLLLNNSLCLNGLAQLAQVRAKNVLRWWFAKNQLAMPSSEHLSEIINQLLNAKADANINIQLNHIGQINLSSQINLSCQTQHLTLKRFQHRAYLLAEQSTPVFDLLWTGEAELNLPNGGKLHFKQVMGAGLALKFGMTKLRITNRAGGERFKPNVLRPTRTLKHLLQEANIPPWQRNYLPLIYWHDTLAFVPYIGMANELQATEHELGLEITWQDLSV